MHTLENMQGKMLLIDNLYLETVHRQVNLSFDTNIEGTMQRIVCKNISSLQINSFSYPMQISGFAVADNSAKGWQADVRYEVYDYEDGAIRFFCEDITISD